MRRNGGGPLPADAAADVLFLLCRGAAVRHEVLLPFRLVDVSHSDRVSTYVGNGFVEIVYDLLPRRCDLWHEKLPFRGFPGVKQ